MRTRFLPAAGAAVLLAVVGCGADEVPESAPVAEEALDIDQEEGDQAEAEPLEWGEPATVLGNEGGEVELVPAGIRYYDQDDLADLTEEDMLPQGAYVIVQFDATAQNAQDSLSWSDGSGFSWRADGQQISRGDSGDPPWAGRITGFYGEPILPDEGARSGLVYFDIPEAGQGHLSFADDMSGSVVRWQVPEQAEGDEGPLWDDIDTAVTEWSQ